MIMEDSKIKNHFYLRLHSKQTVYLKDVITGPEHQR